MLSLKRGVVEKVECTGPGPVRVWQLERTVSLCSAETSPVQRSRESQASREESEKQEESILESLKI